MEKTKYTQREMYKALRAMVEQIEAVGEIPSDAMLDFIDKRVAMLDKKSETAQKKAAERAAASDELQAKIKAVLTEDYQSAEDILAQIEGEGLTKNKIVARLTKLINAGEATKDQVKDEETKRKFMAYKLA